MGRRISRVWLALAIALFGAIAPMAAEASVAQSVTAGHTVIVRTPVRVRRTHARRVVVVRPRRHFRRGRIVYY